MIGGECGGEHLTRDHGAVAHHGALLAPTGGKNRNLRWRDDRGELCHWEATEIAEGERCV